MENFPSYSNEVSILFTCSVFYKFHKTLPYSRKTSALTESQTEPLQTDNKQYVYYNTH